MEIIIHKTTVIEFIKSHIEYFTSPWGFLLGYALAPFWVNTALQGVIGLIFAMITVVLTFFIKKYLEARFKDIFKTKNKL